MKGNFAIFPLGKLLTGLNVCTIIILSFVLVQGDCDFEKFGTCTYYQDQVEDTFDWIRGSGGTSSWRTGPTIDNTKKDSSGINLNFSS